MGAGRGRWSGRGSGRPPAPSTTSPSTDHAQAQRARSAVSRAAGALGLRLTDLVGEHPDVERAGRLVLVHVLAVGLIALYEIPGRAPKTAPPLQADLHGFRDDVTRELAALSPTHAHSLRSWTLSCTPTLRHPGRRYNVDVTLVTL